MLEWSLNWLTSEPVDQWSGANRARRRLVCFPIDSDGGFLAMPRAFPESMHLEAAAMLARDVPVKEVARQLGVTPRTVLNWSKTQEAEQHIASIKASVRQATKHLAIADKVRRVIYAQQMRDGIDAVIAARRQAGIDGQQRQRILDPDPVPGEETGHVAVKDVEIKGVRTREAAFDAALHDQARKWNEYAAKELGEWEVGVNVRHSGRVDHVVRRPDLSALSDEDLEQLAELAEKVALGEVEA